jgi:hypothetical protein
MYGDLQTRKARLHKFDWVDAAKQAWGFITFWSRVAVYTLAVILIFLGLTNFFAITGLAI